MLPQELRQPVRRQPGERRPAGGLLARTARVLRAWVVRPPGPAGPDGAASFMADVQLVAESVCRRVGSACECERGDL